MQQLFLHPRDLDIAAPHLFWAAPADAALIASLDRLGQTTPALAGIAEGRPILIAGSRRAAALRTLRGRTLAAVTVDLLDPQPEAPGADLALPLRLGMLYLASNLGRAVTDAMAVAAGRYFTANGSLDEFLALAGPTLFPEGDRRGRLVASWLGLPPAWDALLASGNVPLGAAGRLAGLDPVTLAALFPLAGAVRWSRGSLENALVFLVEAARLAGESPSAALVRSGALDLPGRGLSPNDLSAGILAALRRLRYPALTTLEARFAALSRELLPAGSRVKVRPSQGFETDAFAVETLVRRPDDLARAAADLAAMAASPVLPRLLAVAHDEDPA